MDINVDLSVFYVLICFFIVFFVAKNTLLKRLDQILEERHGLIEGSQADAESNDELIQEKIEFMNSSLAEAREKAFNRRAESRDKALVEQKGIVDSARGESSRQLESAQADLDASVADARAQLKQESESFARAIADSLMRRSA